MARNFSKSHMSHVAFVLIGKSDLPLGPFAYYITAIAIAARFSPHPIAILQKMQKV